MKIKPAAANLVIIGTSGHAKVVYDVFSLTLKDRYNLAGFVTSDKIRKFLEIPVLGDEAAAGKIYNKHKITHAFIAIGAGFHRERIYRDLISRYGIKSVNIIHPRAIIAKNAELGTGNFIGARAVVNACASIGNYCLINSAAIIEHDCVIDDFATISPGARIGGKAKIGKRSFIGMGANVNHKQRIFEDVVIGSGATVVSDIKANSVAVGCPAKIIKKRKLDDIYL